MNIVKESLFENQSRKTNPIVNDIIRFVEKYSWLTYHQIDDNILTFSTRDHGSVYHEKYSHIDYIEAKRIGKEVEDSFSVKSIRVEAVDEWVILSVILEPEKKIEREFSKEVQQDIKYLHSYVHPSSLDIIIEHFNLTDDQIHNLRIAHEYNYIDKSVFSDTINNTINDFPLNASTENEFKKAFESDFRKRIKWRKPPYKVMHRWNSYDKNTVDEFSLNEIIGDVDGKYVIGHGIFRGYNRDRKTLWELYKKTRRESEFISVIPSKNVNIIDDDELKEILKRIWRSYEYKKGRKTPEINPNRRFFPRR